MFDRSGLIKFLIILFLICLWKNFFNDWLFFDLFVGRMKFIVVFVFLDIENRLVEMNGVIFVGIFIMVFFGIGCRVWFISI